MNKKEKLFISHQVDLCLKSNEDSFKPLATAACTGSDFNFEDKFSQTATSSKFMKPNSMHSIRNIFDDVNNEERKKYIDSQIGPRFEDDKKEKIVKWSIVGKPEQFLSVRNRNRQKVVIKQKKGDGDDSFSDDVPSSVKPIMLQQSQSQISGMGQQRKTPKKPRGEFKMLPRQEALIKMVEAKKRIETNLKDKLKYEQNLPLHFQNAVTRDKRILDKFDLQKEKWEFFNNQIASNCERNPFNTIMIRSDNYREKNQKISIIESLKNEDEKYNNRLWYMRLRWYDNKDDRPPFTLITKPKQKSLPLSSRLVNRFVKDPDAEHLAYQENFVLSDIQSNFNTKIIENPYQQIEKVISNNKHNKLYSKKLEQMFTDKIKDKPKKRYVDSNEYLEVTGINVYNKELDFIRNNKQQEYQYFEEKQDEQEVYVDNWNSQQLAKTGQPLNYDLK
ncbi:unnamed protein product [Paramecium pentaurelia]|uniref:Uncharacterized protein n=1 Tax=Paramecium pentaurelia TaxID=43138 RepID=A0A8S1VN78_9CILI|nr:unnamed protein product [Paramecium pentaurelia]